MSVRRAGVLPTKMMPAAYAGADPVRGRVERQNGMACVAIQNNGEALYEPQNPSFLICNPYEDPQARLARKECGTVDEIEKIIDTNNIKLVVLALEKTEQPLLEKIINRLGEKDVEVKIQPNTLDILAG